MKTQIIDADIIQFGSKPHKVLVEKSIAWLGQDESMECSHEGNEWVTRKFKWGWVNGTFKVISEEIVKRERYYQVTSYI